MIRIVRGDSKALTVEAELESGVLDLTGGEVKFLVKETFDSDVYLIEKTVIPTTAKATIQLTADDTDITSGEYFCQVKFIKNGAVTTLANTKLSIANTL